MLQSLKRLTKHSAVYGVGHIVSRLVNFLLLPVYTNQIETEAFGVYAVVYMYLAFMTIIYTYGIDAAFLRFFILTDDEARRRRIFSTAFWAVALVGASLTCLIYVFAETNSRIIISEGVYPELFRLASLILLFDALAFLPFLYLRAEERSLQFVAVKLINVLVNVGLNIYFVVYLKKGVTGILLANAWASGITFLLLLPIVLRHVAFLFDLSELKELLAFGLPYLPATLSVVALDLVDRAILERLVGLEVTGIYTAGYKLGIIMNLFVAAFRFAWHPFFLSTSKQKDAQEIFARVMTYFLLLGSFMFLTVSFYVDDVVRFELFGVTLFGESYWAGTRVVPVVLLVYLLYGTYVNLTVGLHLEKKTKYFPIITGAGLVINVAANFALIPRLGMMGAAYAKLLAYAVMVVSVYVITRRFYPVPYEFGRLGKLALLVGLAFYVGSRFQGEAEPLLKLLVLVSLPLLLLLIGFFERRELQGMRRLLSGAVSKATLSG